MGLKPEHDFLHETRHDIRGAMHVVIGMSKVLAMSDTLDPPQKEMVATLKKNADRALELIDNMFDFLQSGRCPDKGSIPVKISPPSEMEPEEDSRDREVLMPASAVSDAADKKPCVLLVEDFEPDAMIAAHFLKKLGYACDVAQSGEEALEKFSAGRYSVLLIDMRMSGMDGLETTQHIRALEQKKNMEPTPILATTGNTNKADQLLCAKAGMNDFLSKPFGLEDLERKLRNIAPHSNNLSQD